MADKSNDGPEVKASTTKEVVQVGGSPSGSGAGAAASKVVEEKEEVVLKPIGSVQEKLSGIQRVGTWLALGVGAVIAFVTVATVVYAFSHAPTPPTLPPDADVAAKLIANYKLLAEAQWTGPAGMFDTIVFKALLPVFTTILGYIFGSRAAAAGQSG